VRPASSKVATHCRNPRSKQLLRSAAAIGGRSRTTTCGL